MFAASNLKCGVARGVVREGGAGLGQSTDADFENAPLHFRRMPTKRLPAKLINYSIKNMAALLNVPPF